MTVSIFLARVFALYFLAMGLAVIFHRKYIQECIDHIFENQAMLFVVSFMTLIIGILLVVAHPTWTSDWRVLITIIAWIALLKGIIFLFFPRHLKVFQRKMLMRPMLYPMIGILTVCLGLFFSYCGFLVA